MALPSTSPTPSRSRGSPSTTPTRRAAAPAATPSTEPPALSRWSARAAARRAGWPAEPPPSPYAAGLAAALARLLGVAAGARGPAVDGDGSDGTNHTDHTDDADDADDAGEVACSGADLTPGTLLAAYRLGLFPMGLGEAGGRPLGWWSPDPRGVLPLDGLRVSRSLRRSCARSEVRVDTAFDAVVAGCADPSRPGRWITAEVAAGYRALHDLGWAHSVETWRDGELVGGLYGVCVGGLFAGESMFSVATDASKVALVALVDLLRQDADPRRLLDVQWRTPHLASLGVVDVTRGEYLHRLSRALQAPPPPRLLVPPA